MVMSMNVFILTIILAVSIHADSSREKFKQKMLEMPEVQKCMESTGFNLDDSTPHEITPEKLCFFKCIMQEKGTLNENGEVDLSVVNDSPFPIPDDKKEEVKQCVADAGKIETCEDMQKLVDCVPRRH